LSVFKAQARVKHVLHTSYYVSVSDKMVLVDKNKLSEMCVHLLEYKKVLIRVITLKKIDKDPFVRNGHIFIKTCVRYYFKTQARVKH